MPGTINWKTILVLKLFGSLTLTHGPKTNTFLHKTETQTNLRLHWILLNPVEMCGVWWFLPIRLSNDLFSGKKSNMFSSEFWRDRPKVKLCAGIKVHRGYHSF